jgi:hypothetical protein
MVWDDQDCATRLILCRSKRELVTPEQCLPRTQMELWVDGNLIPWADDQYASIARSTADFADSDVFVVEEGATVAVELLVAGVQATDFSLDAALHRRINDTFSWLSEVPALMSQFAVPAAPLGLNETVVEIWTNNTFAANMHSDTFLYSMDRTPLVTNVDSVANEETYITRVIISGAGFNAMNMSAHTVVVGSYDCPVVSVSEMTLECEVFQLSAGVHELSVRVHGLGSPLASVPMEVSASTLVIDSVYPAIGSVSGGIVLTLTGKGFNNKASNNKVTLHTSIGDVACLPRQMENHACAASADLYSIGVQCHIESVYGYASPQDRHYAKMFDFSTYDYLECQVESVENIPDQAVNLTVTVSPVNGLPASESTPSPVFNFSADVLPVIQNIFPSVGVPGEEITITGSAFLPLLNITDTAYYMTAQGWYQQLTPVSVFFWHGGMCGD